MVKVRTASGLINVALMVRDGGGLRAIKAPKLRTTGGLVALSGAAATPYSASVSPDYVYGATDRPGASPTTSSAATVTVQGGSPPYRFAWSAGSGITVLSPSSASTAFRAALSPGASAAGSFFCTVTDSAGRTAVTSAVAVSLDNYGSGSFQ